MSTRDRDTARAREAKESLARVRRDSETILDGAARAASDSGRPDETDPIEVLGTRIGRTAGVVFAIGLLIYLVWTYF